VAAHLIEYGALRQQDVPIGLVWRMRAVEHFQSLFVVSGFGQRATVRAKHRLVARIFDRGLSSTATACARCPARRSACAYRIAFSTLAGSARYC
jgi:hypothetical protein